jgi:hypothetical protein
MPRYAARAAALGLLIACAGVLVALAAQAPASAVCSCERASTRQHSAGADAVFTGTVRDTRRTATDGGRAMRTYIVEVDRVYKEQGTVVTETVEVSSARSADACGLGNLPSGTAYLFFAQARDAGFRAGACGGSGPVTDAATAQVEGVLGPGEAMVPEAEQVEVVLTSVETEPPRSVTRLAAPGAALALLGLLGLVLVRLAGARR